MITKQEMFTRSVTGLRSQGFNRCLSPATLAGPGEPVYNNGQGQRCAWGWVDESISPDPKNNGYYVAGLMGDGVGLAAHLDLTTLNLARQLQWCHDDSPTPATMERRLRQVGEREGLLWPE